MPSHDSLYYSNACKHGCCCMQTATQCSRVLYLFYKVLKAGDCRVFKIDEHYSKNEDMMLNLQKWYEYQVENQFSLKRINNSNNNSCRFVFTRSIIETK